MIAKLFHSIVAAALILAIFALPPANARALESGELLKAADQAYSQRKDLNQAYESAAIYRQVLTQTPSNYEAAWKLTRALIWITEHAPKENKAAAAAEALETGRKLLALDPENPASHFWHGLAMTFYAELKGAFHSLNLLPQIKKEMNAVIAKEPGFMDGGAHMLLGRIQYLVPGLLGGSNKEAIRHLETALSYGPKQWPIHVYLAEVYIDEGRKDDARRLLTQVMAGPAQPDMEPEYEEVLRKAKKLLNKLDKDQRS